jgi:hypothetical protein
MSGSYQIQVLGILYISFKIRMCARDENTEVTENKNNGSDRVPHVYTLD